MNTRSFVKLWMRRSILALAAVFGIAIFAAMDVNAQTMQRQNREDRQDRREDRRDDRRDARQDGYRDGLREGAEDARARRRSNPTREVAYRRAGGENSHRERQAYRNGFVQGYNEGYRNNRRRGY
jgi:flagellar biosynthesis/type III secretory pathway protein FliH